jgi:O-antigen/teichoic acid export membrane protein
MDQGVELKRPGGFLSALTQNPAVASLLNRGAWGLADQGLLSLATFVTLALIARANSPHEFGLFSLAFAFINLEMTLASSLLTEPFAVIAAAYEKDRYKAYVTSTYLMHLSFALLISVGLAAGGLLFLVFGWGRAELLFLVIPAMLAWQLQDFTRQPLYVEGRVSGAFFNDVVSYGGQILLVALATYFDVLTSAAALGIVAVTSGTAILVGLAQLRGSISLRVSFTEAIGYLKETWRFGRWILGGTFLTSSSYYLQPFVLAVFRSATAAGELRAMMTLLGPARIIIRGSLTAFTPMASATYEAGGLSRLHYLIKRTFLLTAPLMGTYCLLVVIRPTDLVTFLLGKEYAGSASWLLPLVALSFFLQILVLPFDIGLRALRLTNPLFRVGVWTFIAFWCVGVPLTYVFGLLGAALMAVLVPLIVVIELGLNYRRAMSGREEAAVAS